MEWERIPPLHTSEHSGEEPLPPHLQLLPGGAQGSLKSCRNSWGSSQGCTWSMQSSWRGAEGAVKGQGSVPSKNSHHRAGQGPWHSHLGAKLNCSDFFLKSSTEAFKCDFCYQSYSRSIHLPACATSIWPIAHNTLLSQDM